MSSLEDAFTWPSPDDLYLLVISLQTRSDETEAAINDCHASIRPLSLECEQLRKQLVVDTTSFTRTVTQVPAAEQLEDCSRRMCRVANALRADARQDAEAEEEALWALLEKIPPLAVEQSPIGEQIQPVPPHALEGQAPLDDESDELQEDLGGEAVSVPAPAPHDRRMTPSERARWATVTVLSSLGMVAKAWAAVTRNHAPAAAASDNTLTAAANRADVLPPSATPARKRLTFVGGSGEVTYVPVTGHNAAREPWPPRRARNVEVVSEDGCIVGPTLTDSAGDPTPVLCPRLEATAAGSAAVAFDAPRRVQVTRRRTTWTLGQTQKLH